MTGGREGQTASRVKCRGAARRGSRVAAGCLLTAACVWWASPITAQSAADASRWADSLAWEIDRAAIVGDTARLEAARVLAERAVAAFPQDAMILHQLATALYRQAMLNQDDDDVLKRTEAELGRSAETAPLPETYAMLASVIGMQIGSSPLRGMTLGPRANAMMSRALELGPTNPRVWMAHGISAVNTPRMFGGGTDRAIERLQQAVTYFEEEAGRDPAGPAWGHAEAYAWLGIAYTRDEQWDRAAAALDEALRLEPDFAWVSGPLRTRLAEARRR